MRKPNDEARKNELFVRRVRPRNEVATTRRYTQPGEKGHNKYLPKDTTLKIGARNGTL